ncbi:HlyD family secretion protein [Vallitalea okinawensis]|uniref:HlyD family secretion protein n=1 Tax=Vallitalea okinawensis TaxID=2078660 RepID=UPI000CFDB554|nr:efflux RND transporter periplasmic adaptor subunit [Vallitalea okinawensis]
MKKLISLLLIVGLVVSGTGCSEKVEGASDDQSNGEKSNQVEEVDERDTIEIFGTVEAAEKKLITLQFPVRINDLIIDEGQQVGAEEKIMELDLLGQLDDYKSLENNIKVIEDQIVNQKIINDNLSSQLQKKENGLYNRSLPEIEAKQISYDIANSNYEEAKSDLEESDKLYQEGFISQDDYDNEKQNLYNLEKQILMEKSNLDLCIATVNSQIAELKTKLIENEKILSDLEEVQLTESKLKMEKITNQLKNNSDLKDTFIINSFNEGLIEKVYCEEGQVVNQGSPIVSLIDKSSIYVKGEVPEEFVGLVEEGATVNVIPVYDKTKSYEGVVTQISQVATNKNNEIIVIIDIQLHNIDENLKPNYNVNIEIEK